MKQQPTYLINALQNLKIEALNAMQEASVEAYLTGKDLILLSPTGSGKTLAYLLPLLGALKADVKGVQAVVLVPSRELALQIDQVFKSMNTGFNSMSCYGGRPAMEEHRTMKGIQPALIIGTPGRMNDHLGKQNFDAATVTTLVIDEFDKCLEFGFQEEMSTIIEQLPSLNRRLLISATDAAEIPLFTGVNESVKLDFLHTKKELENRLRLFRVQSPSRDKLDTLYQLLCTLGNESTLVFCNHRESVDRVGQFLQSKKLPCGMFHGGMEQDARERSLYKFRNGSCYVLVSTDLAARGLDIAEVGHVIHYHTPPNKEGYIHRNGRTARWDAEGNAYLILHGEEQLPDYVTEEVEDFAFPETTPKPLLPNYVTWYIGKGKKEKVNKIDIVGFLSKKGQLGKEDIGQIDVKDHYAFVAVSRKKSKQALSLVRNERIKGLKTVIEEAK
ncbi:MAG: DEAD/DEAH box helicase [Phocaeicola sp.]